MKSYLSGNAPSSSGSSGSSNPTSAPSTSGSNVPAGNIFIIVIMNAVIYLYVFIGATLTVYTDGLSSGWQDWSWATSYSLSDSSYAHSGSYPFSSLISFCCVFL